MTRRFRVTPTLGRRSRSITIGKGSNDSLSLGRLTELGPKREVALSLDSEHVVAIVGKRGSGKTHTLGVLVEGLGAPETPGVRSGGSLADHAVLVFDTLNLFQWLAIPMNEAKGLQASAQLESADRWHLSPLDLRANFWHPAGFMSSSSDSKSFQIRPREMEAQDWGRLLDVDVVTEPMGQLLTDVWDKVTRTGWLGGAGAAPAREDYTVNDLIDCVRSDRNLSVDYAPETLRAVRQRLTAYERTELFSPDGTGLNEILHPGQVTVFLLARVPEDLRAVVVFLLIRRLLEERAAASEVQKNALITGQPVPDGLIPPTWLVIDEAQNIIPSRSVGAANDILTRFVREGRNFGLSLAITTQQPHSIEKRVMAQVDILIAHTLTVRQDISYVTSNLKSAEPASIALGNQSMTISEALRELDVGQCLVSAVDAERSLFVEIRPRVTLHGGFEA